MHRIPAEPHGKVLLKDIAVLVSFKLHIKNRAFLLCVHPDTLATYYVSWVF